MRIVPVNEAEAIIEPFWDGGSSEHPANTLSLLDSYATAVSHTARAKVTQGWCASEVRIDRSEPGAQVVTMERACNLTVADYDVFRVLGSLPSWVRMAVTATIDGGECLLIDTTGADTSDEFDGGFHGARMTGLQLAFGVTEPRPATVSLMWLGLSNRRAQDRIEARTSPYTPDWPGSLEPKAKHTGPEIGIYFDDKGLRHDVSLRYRTGPGAAHLSVQGLISASCSGDTWTIEEEPDHDQSR